MAEGIVSLSNGLMLALQARGRGWQQPWRENQLYSNFSMTSKKTGAEGVA
jgi:hypothetical protein